MSRLKSKRKSIEDKAIDIIDRHIFHLLDEIEKLESESKTLYTLARAHVFDKLEGCKRRNYLLLAEFYCKSILTKEFVEELVASAVLLPAVLIDPVKSYSKRIAEEEDAYVRFVNDGELPLFGPLDRAEIAYFNDSLCVHVMAPQCEPRLHVTAIEDSWPDDWGDVDEQHADMVLHQIGSHQQFATTDW